MKEKKTAVRTLLINKENKFLFFKIKPSCSENRKSFWISPGGKIDNGESLSCAAHRELYEETGIEAHKVELGPVLFEHEAKLIYHDTTFLLYQYFIPAYTLESSVSFDRHTESEKGYIEEYKWLSLDEINSLKEDIWPVGIQNFLPNVLNKEFPSRPSILKKRSYLC